MYKITHFFPFLFFLLLPLFLKHYYLFFFIIPIATQLILLCTFDHCIHFGPTSTFQPTTSEQSFKNKKNLVITAMLKTIQQEKVQNLKHVLQTSPLSGLCHPSRLMSHHHCWSLHFNHRSFWPILKHSMSFLSTGTSMSCSPLYKL